MPPTDVLVVSQAQLPMYLLTRISIVPWSLILTAVWTRTSHSAATLSSSLIATLSLLIATTGADFHFTPGSLVLGLTSSFCTALFPMLLLQTYRGLVSSIIAHRHGHSDYDPLSNDASNALKSKAELRAFWLTLRYTSLLASAILLPVVLLSNEPSDISRNCYVLDVKVFWTIFICSGIGSWCVLVCTLLLVQSTSPLTATFLSVPRSAFQLLVLSPTRMPLHSVIGVIMCWLSSVWFTISKRRERGNWPSNHAKSILLALRNAIIAVILYHGVYQLLYWGHTGLVDLKGTPSLSWKVPNTPATNAHANWINRPESAVTPKDDYLGVRPHVDTVANASMLVAKCRSFYKSTETDHDGVSCLSWLASAVDEYHVLPEAGRLLRASEQDPRKAEYANADGHENTLSHYASPDSVELSSMTSIGTCAGPIIPYHVYWTGPASWRVELFIKSYLYTQNLPCSRLWLWVDSDRNPDAPDEMLNEDPLFDRFKPLVRRGDVVVKVWKFPERIALPKEFPLANQAKPEEVAGPPDANGDVTIADAVVRDMKGRQWLVFPPRMALFPEVVSDLVRFVVLHLHGGVYCDMDILFLRDMRPLLLPEPSTGHHSFAEHWVERSHPADYNTAVMSLTAKSSLSTYLLHGGVRMGMNYHPKVIGRMAWKDERNQELLMLDTAAFDPSTPYMNHNLRHRCTTPCHRYYSDVFNGRTNDLPDEWRAYNGERLEEITFKRDELNEREEDGASSTIRGDGLQAPGTPVSLGYGVEKDRYRPSNRTLQNFFRGAWTYHIHNQVCPHHSTHAIDESPAD